MHSALSLRKGGGRDSGAWYILPGLIPQAIEEADLQLSGLVNSLPRHIEDLLVARPAVAPVVHGLAVACSAVTYIRVRGTSGQASLSRSKIRVRSG